MANEKEKTTKLLTIAQAAERLGIHQNTLRTWADKGLVPHVRTPTGYRRFDPVVIEQFLADMQMDAGERDRRPGEP
jgi:excisionase family DNA binding protein